MDKKKSEAVKPPVDLGEMGPCFGIFVGLLLYFTIL